MAWAAIATASMMRADAIHTWKAIWWAATSTRPIRAATEVPTRNVPVNERLRTSRRPLTTSSRRIDLARGTNEAWFRRTARPTQAR